MPETTEKIPNKPLRFLMYITRKNKWSATAAILSTILAQLLGMAAYYSISRLVDAFSVAPDQASQLNVLWVWGLIFFTLSAGDRLLWRFSGFAGVNWLIEMHARGYKDLYAYLSNHSQTYFANRFAGALSNKVSNAVDGATRLTERTLWGFGPEIISMISTVYLFWLVHWSIAAILFVAIVIIFSFNMWFVKIRRPYVVEYSKASSKVRGEGVDIITNNSAVRQYVRSGYELSRLDKVVEDRLRKDKKQAFLGEYLMIINACFGLMLTALVLGMTYYLLQNSLATAGQLVLVLILLGRIGFIFTIMGNMLNGFIRVYGEMEEGLDEILIPHEILDDSDAGQLIAKEGEIRWNNVDFSFDNIKVFKNFNLVIEGGERLGLVGHSGAGKTTFVSLLLRQLEIDGGIIGIDGQDISKITQDSLRENITVVPQEPLLFHRSIKENILYGKPDATDEEIIEVAKKAQAHEFIMKLSQGYDTLVGERGVKLSGGQKQRVAIARAMLKDAPILILDEATSALDSESEVLIQKALETLMEGKTVIAIAHRLSTLRKMDRIIVLEDGEIKEDGTHDELTHSSGIYQKLWEHQAGGFIPD